MCVRQSSARWMLYPWQLLCEKPFSKCKTSVCSKSFSLKYFYGLLDTLKSKGTHSPLSSSRKLPRARYNTTSDVKRPFSSHFISEQIKEFYNFYFGFFSGQKKGVGIFPFFFSALCRTNVQIQDSNKRTIIIMSISGAALKIQVSCPGARLQGQNYRCQPTYWKKYARRDR